VFSVIVDDVVQKKYVQCPNCGIVHLVVEINRSDIVQNREHMSSALTIDDIRSSLPQKLSALLDANDVDQATWEQAKFICDEKRWGDVVLLTSDTEGNVKQGKYVVIVGEGLFTVDTFVREEVIV
jgi:hypothetical protein